MIPSPLPSAAFPSNAATPLPTPDGSTYFDMYEAANKSGLVTMDNIGHSMFSGNQGTPTCWGNIDCTPGETCMVGAASGISGFPSNLGICVGAGGFVNGQTNCMTVSDIGKGCGGYPNSGVYTCVASSVTTGDETGVACVPAFAPPTMGLGPYDSADGLFTGVGAPLNPEWLAAALVAGGGTTPYYETFSTACPNQYAWVHDDHAGGFSCSAFPADFTVAFGALSGSATATATPSATATSSSTATPTASATATATATATDTSVATATPTATTTATASATATSTATATATATAGTPTATATTTGTATATATVTLTPTATATTTATRTATPSPTPSGIPTPICSPSVYLQTSPAGTLAFGSTNVGTPIKQTLQVSNEEPVGSLKLSAKIATGNAKAFSITGGSCRSSSKLKAGQSCNYRIKMKARKKDINALTTLLTITGSFKPGVCRGHVQTATETLAGFVNPPSKH